MSSPADLDNKDQFIELSDGSHWYPGRNTNDISIEVLAHSMSGIARFNAHARRMNGHVYTLAEHSVKVSYLVPTLTGLLHDAHEVIVHDMAKPIKVYVGGSYAKLEKKVEREFADLFGLDFPHGPAVKHADILMVLIESFDLLPSQGSDWGYYQEFREEARALCIERPELRPECWKPDEAAGRFLRRFENLKAIT